MNILVNLHAILTNYYPKGCQKPYQFSVEPGSQVSDVIKFLKIPREYVSIVLCQGLHMKDNDYLRDGIEIDLFPPIAGG